MRYGNGQKVPLGGQRNLGGYENFEGEKDGLRKFFESKKVRIRISSPFWEAMKNIF